MDNAFWQAVASTPWWAYAIFTYLFWIALVARKPHVISIRQITFLPMIPIALSLALLCYLLPLTTLNISLWLGGALFGAGWGFLQLRRPKTKVLDESNLYVPGSWTLLILLVGGLAAKIYFKFSITSGLNLFSKPAFIASIFLSYGMFTGLFLGRTYGARLLFRVH